MCVNVDPTWRERALALAQTAVKTVVRNLVNLLLRMEALARCMHPSADEMKKERYVSETCFNSVVILEMLHVAVIPEH